MECRGYLVKFGCYLVKALGLGLASLWVMADVPAMCSSCMPVSEPSAMMHPAMGSGCMPVSEPSAMMHPAMGSGCMPVSEPSAMKCVATAGY